MGPAPGREPGNRRFLDSVVHGGISLEPIVNGPTPYSPEG